METTDSNLLAWILFISKHKVIPQSLVSDQEIENWCEQVVTIIKITLAGHTH